MYVRMEWLNRQSWIQRAASFKCHGLCSTWLQLEGAGSTVNEGGGSHVALTGLGGQWLSPNLLIWPPPLLRPDPNGPFFFRGVWHQFYQYLPHSSKWDWGLMWGHAVSLDKVRARVVFR